jgi:hypothetical protein
MSLMLYNNVVICGIYGQVSTIFFNNTPCQFPLRFIIIINNIQELLFWFYVFLWYYSTCAQDGTDCCTIMWSMPRCWQCSSVTAQVTAAMSQVQYSLQMLPHMVCGCTTTTVDGLCMAAVMWGNMPPYSFWMTHSSLFWDKWLYTPLRRMLVCSECLAFYVTQPPDWLLCDWRVSKACHTNVTLWLSCCQYGMYISGLLQVFYCWEQHIGKKK